MSQADDIAIAIALCRRRRRCDPALFPRAGRDRPQPDASPVTEADKAAEIAMRDLIEKYCPGDGIIGEEYGTTRGEASRIWVLDPIDGTRSFIAGRPIFGTLIALMQDGWPVLGIIDQPVSGERWFGAMGLPTTLNGKPIRTRRCRDLDEATIATTGPQYFPGHTGEHFSILAGQCRDTIWAATCYNYGLLASGHVDIVVEAGLSCTISLRWSRSWKAQGVGCATGPANRSPTQARAMSSPSATRRGSTM